jgi:hypothetical protein
MLVFYSSGKGTLIFENCVRACSESAHFSQLLAWGKGKKKDYFWRGLLRNDSGA